MPVAYETPLLPGQIRLLQVLEIDRSPASGSPLIRGTQKIVDLNTNPIFKALSYTWDYPYRKWIYNADGQVTDLVEDTAIIPRRPRFIIDGLELQGKENLFAALEAFEYEARTGWIWVDAICLRQDNDAEKALQVQNMCHVYHTASAVLVYLGGEVSMPSGSLSDVHELLSKFLPNLTKAIQDGRMRHPRLTAWTARSPAFHKDVGVQDLTRKIGAFMQFCGMCRWFSRLWCYQELALAKKVDMRCHTWTFASDSLVDLINVLVRQCWENLAGAEEGAAFYSGLSSAGYKTLKHGRMILQFREEFLSSCCVDAITKAAEAKPYFDDNLSLDDLEDFFGERSQILGTLGRFGRATKARLMSRAFGGVPKSDITTPEQWQVCAKLFVLAASAHCSDARDRVYGLLGILQACLGRDMDEIIPVDYSISVESLYTGFTALLLDKTERLELLGALDYQVATDSNDMASWVVDFRRQSNTAYDNVHWNVERKVTSLDLFPAESALVTTSEKPFQIRGSKLHLLGACYDTIALTIELRESLDGLDLLKELSDLLPTHISGRRRLNTIARTLICNVIDREVPTDLDVEWLFLLGLCVKEMGRVIREISPAEEVIKRFSEVVGQFDCSEPLSSQLFFEMLKISSCLTPSCFSQYTAQGHFPNGSEADAANIEAVKLKLLQSFFWSQESAFRYTYSMLTQNDGRKLFVTKRGLLGTCPRQAQSGDEVWILKGSDSPFVLRPIEKSCNYCFVGSIFMLDVMDGGALRERPQLKDELREITIV